MECKVYRLDGDFCYSRLFENAAGNNPLSVVLIGNLHSQDFSALKVVTTVMADITSAWYLGLVTICFPDHYILQVSYSVLGFLDLVTIHFSDHYELENDLSPQNLMIQSLIDLMNKHVPT